jgi:CIC family chloride channel protein
VTIGSGGSAGPEGPIIQIGAALASGLGQLLRLPAHRLRTLLACGAAAGLAGMYHAPFTGAAFSAEVLLEELEPRTFSLLALAAVAADAVAGQLRSERPVTLPPLPPAPALDVPLDIVLGLLAAPLGVLLLVLVHGVGDAVGRLRVRTGAPAWALPAIGGFIVGCIGLVLPHILGSSETGIDRALNDQLGFGLLLVLPLAKILTTSITLGSGATGGVFTPSLFIGATLGGAYGVVVRHFWGGASPVGAYALVGMGTVVAAAVNAPLTAGLLVCEFTGGFALLPQIVAGVAASVIVARLLHAESIYTLPLRRHGIDRMLRRRSPLAATRVADVMSDSWPVLAPGEPLRRAVELARATAHTVFPVVGPEGHYVGLLSLDAVTNTLQRAEAAGAVGAAAGAEMQERPVETLALPGVPVVDPGDSLHEVALTLARVDQLLTVVPVLERATGRYVGVMERVTLLRAYSSAADSTAATRYAVRHNGVATRS